jgi:hypothetical protein
MIAFPTSPEVDALRAAAVAANDAARTLEQKLQAGRTRAPKLAEELALAIANGDDAAASSLRAERTAIEQDSRDLSAAIIIASRRADDADKALAVAEWPLIESALADAVTQFNTFAASAHALANDIRAAIPRAGSRWTVAFTDDGDPSTREDRPLRKVPALLSPVARVIYRETSDLTL